MTSAIPAGCGGNGNNVISPTGLTISGVVWDISNILSTSPASGVTVTTEPAGPAILYNNGNDVYIASGSTTGTYSLSASYSQVGGYGSSSGVYTFTLTDATDATKNRSLKLPLVMGEMTYVAL